jgi:S-adenosylmethionine:tRNA ribosyltransferase-isomerase
MKLSDFDFDLPEALIATRPASPRSRPGCWWPKATRSAMPMCATWCEMLRPGDRLVLNDTRVIPAG